MICIFGRSVTSNYRILASAGTAQIFGQMIRAGRTIVIPLFAAEVLGLAVDQIGLIVSISVAVDFSLFVVAGWLMDRVGRKFAIVPCFGIQALGMALVPFATSYSSLLLAAVLIGIGNGLGAGTMMTLGRGPLAVAFAGRIPGRLAVDRRYGAYGRAAGGRRGGRLARA